MWCGVRPAAILKPRCCGVCATDPPPGRRDLRRAGRGHEGVALRDHLRRELAILSATAAVCACVHNATPSFHLPRVSHRPTGGRRHQCARSQGQPAAAAALAGHRQPRGLRAAERLHAQVRFGWSNSPDLEHEISRHLYATPLPLSTCMHRASVNHESLDLPMGLRQISGNGSCEGRTQGPSRLSWRPGACPRLMAVAERGGLVCLSLPGAARKACRRALDVLI